MSASGSDWNEDVHEVSFRIVNVEEDCDAAPSAERSLRLNAVASAAAVETNFTLDPGEYRICLVPLNEDGQPSDRCRSADGIIVVKSGAIAEHTLTAQCGQGEPGGVEPGGVDVTGELNWPPTILDILFDPSDSMTVCETTTITIAASDPNEDVLSYVWEVIDSPVGSNPAVSGTGDRGMFSTDQAGAHTLSVSVSDGTLVTSATIPIDITEADAEQLDCAGSCIAPCPQHNKRDPRNL